MEQLKRLIWEIHRRSLWQVLAIYVGASWLVFEVVQTLTEGLGLPDWFPSFALVLLLVGLPIVLATAFVQEGAFPIRRADPTLVPERHDTHAAREPRGRKGGSRGLLTWRKALLGGLAAFALWGVVATGWLFLADRGPAEGDGVADAAESGSEAVQVAVLPFEVTGPDMDLWREGMVQLLSSNLDGLGGIRRSDPRAILSHWRSLENEAGIAGSSLALQVAHRVVADIAVTGQAVAFGPRLRLSAEIRDVNSAEVLARAQVEGAPDSILALADRLTLDLLGSGQLAIDVQLSRVTLSGLRDVPLPALRRFLEGERHYNRGSYDEAIENYLKAVAADSTFALAYYRISSAYGWREGSTQQIIRRFQRAALRYADHLPERVSRLLSVVEFRGAGQVAALSAAENFTRRYPDDVEGWYQLGEAYTHVGPRALEPTSRLRAPFYRALALDPHFGNAYIHLIQEAFFQADSSGARALIDSFAAVSPENPRVGGYRIAYVLVWDETLSREGARSMLRASDSRDLWNVQSALDKSPRYADELIEVGRIESEPERSAEDRLHGARDQYWAYRYRGRIQEARQARQTALVLENNSSSAEMARLDLQFYVWGYGEIDEARQAREALSGALSVHDHFYLAALAADEGDWAEVERQIARLQATVRESDSAPDVDTERAARGVVQAIRVYSALRRGELELALEEFREPMPYLDDAAHAVLRYGLGLGLLNAERQREAERYFVSLIDTLNKTPFQVLSRYQLGRTYEALDEPEKARLHYGRFVQWWADCDPHLRPLWERGRQALARLTEEAA